MVDVTIWTEKYRPQTFLEVRGQKDIVKRVEAFVKQKNMPHLLFAGSAGIGKSTLALVTAKELFGDTWRNNFLELNASDERGIDVVRIKVKDFARTKAIGDVPFKIIFLDECDALTREAQQALRRTMENYTKTCRFILSCNYSSKILDPIQSRCVVFKFKPLPKDEIYLIIDKIAKIEGFTISEDGKLALFEVSQGDCRKVENILQSCAAISKEITEKTVYSIASQALPKEITQILTLSIDGKILESRKEMLNIMYENGLSGLDIIKQISSSIWKLDIENLKKLAMIKLCGEIEFRLVEGSDEFIQLQALLAGISLISNP
ncbi:replication factor C small subunit [archaeon]|jgi:replication factor C small subunit|nr:replication factor C small subunit [archaeon]MBT4272235.1 replication factor C small subunit [archaeon]MBT4460612.1 replication factor C small subunit [archaeon]MBT4857979.1 replication factor C small subunit [archaeon]MBT5424174.1 replication factor C small subunit [archaeon]